jgi:hypothetical protein
MFSLNSLISVAKSNILSNVSLHTIPPISDLEIMVHLIPSWMNGIGRFMCFTKYLPFVPQYSFIIFQKTRRFFFLDVALYLLNLLVFYLTFSNLLK